MSESNFLCVYFKKDNTYTIIEDIKNKLKNSKKSNIKNELSGVWEIGEIVYRGIISIFITEMIILLN